MQRFPALFVIIALLLCSGASVASDAKPLRVLFVGNSLTYVGNLPAVFDALSRANGRNMSSDMIVKGGGTLTDRINDGSVQSALNRRKYDYVVLQERGGDFLCSFGPKSCEDARASLSVLAESSRKTGAKPILLGTYQSHPMASADIVRAEADAARESGMPYVAISDTLQAGISSAPELRWFDSDGMHPGRDLVLLDAMLIFRELFGATPVGTGFTVEAPIYPVAPRLKPEVRPAAGDGVDTRFLAQVTYDVHDVERVGKLLGRSPN